MGSAEQNISKQSQPTAEDAVMGSSVEPPAERPKLVSPPQRPVRPVRPVAEPAPAAHKPASSSSSPAAAAPAVATAANDSTAVETDGPRYQPIAPPSEPMQYRAIGLVRGTYAPAEAEQLNRGNLTTDDGCVIDSVLLGRVTSLVKKHLDLEASHLWVVYPRTRRDTDPGQDEQDLHLQIVGVWEPETLGLPGEEKPAVEEEAEDKAEEAVATEQTAEAARGSAPETDHPPKSPPDSPNDLAAVDENFFSIRGEVVKHEPEEQCITVKIMQSAKRPPGNAKPFKLMLQGNITGRTVGYFWDFKVKRDQKLLVVQEASAVGIVPPKKRPKGSSGGPRRGKPGGRGPGGRPGPSRRPVIKGSDRPRKPSIHKSGGDSDHEGQE
jgi:hypothetical protein